MFAWAKRSAVGGAWELTVRPVVAENLLERATVTVPCEWPNSICKEELLLFFYLISTLASFSHGVPRERGGREEDIKVSPSLILTRVCEADNM